MGGYIGATAVGLTTTAADVQGDITSTDTTPELILKNTSEEDTEGGREGKITFKGEQSGGEESTLAQIESAHDGTSDDEAGDLIFKTNDGSDGASPTERMRIDSEGQVTITRADNGTNLLLESTDADANSAPELDLYRNSASPADNDYIGRIKFIGRNDASQDFTGVDFLGRTIDVSDGTEDASLFVNVMTGGAAYNRLNITPTEVVFNEESRDVDFRVESDGNANMLFVDAGNDKVGIGTTSPSANLHVAQDGNNVALYAGGGGYNFQAKFESSDAEAAIIIEDSNSTNDGNRIGVVTNDMTFITNNSERMRLTANSSASILYGKTTTATTTRGIETRTTGSDTGRSNISTSGGEPFYFYYSVTGAEVGSITHSSTSTSFNTSSDYRLKENVTDVTDGITRIKQLTPKRFNFIATPNTTVDGFLAHEAQTVVPEAVIGIHNEVEVWKDGEELPDGVSVGDNKLDGDGNTIPKYQGIDQSKLVPLLTAALQEAIAKIEALETQNTTQATQIADLITRVETLEGA